MDLALNDLQKLIYQKPTNQPTTSVGFSESSEMNQDIFRYQYMIRGLFKRSKPYLKRKVINIFVVATHYHFL